MNPQGKPDFRDPDTVRDPSAIDAAVAERRLHITAGTPAEIKFAGSSRASSTHGNLVAGGSG